MILLIIDLICVFCFILILIHRLTSIVIKRNNQCIASQKYGGIWIQLIYCETWILRPICFVRGGYWYCTVIKHSGMNLFVIWTTMFPTNASIMLRVCRYNTLRVYVSVIIIIQYIKYWRNIIWNLHQNLGTFPALLGQHLLVVIREAWDRIRCFIYSNVFVSAQVIIYLQFIFPVWYCFIILHLSLFFTSTLDCSFLILNTRTYFSRSFKPLSKPLVAEHRITI